MKKIIWIKDPIQEVLDTTYNAQCTKYCKIRGCAVDCREACDIFEL